MPLPQLARYADTVRYDAERGLALALDWRAYPAETALVAYSDAEAIVHAIESGAVRHAAAAYLAGYGLALAAREWAARPSDARRGALIQAGEWLRRAAPGDIRLSRLLDQALARADAATLAGEDAEAALLRLVQGEISRADRVAERCGRIAAGLLDAGDHVLTHGFAGPALLWMLHVALAEQSKPITLAVLAAPTPDDDARLCADLARAIGLPSRCWMTRQPSAPSSQPRRRSSSPAPSGSRWMAVQPAGLARRATPSWRGSMACRAMCLAAMAPTRLWLRLRPRAT